MFSDLYNTDKCVLYQVPVTVPGFGFYYFGSIALLDAEVAKEHRA